MRSFLPMCAWCRAIRTPEEKWVPLHEYVSETQQVSHGMCPVCAHNLNEEAAI